MNYRIELGGNGEDDAGKHERGNMEVSFKEEIELLKLGAGEVFHGEGILAITKALLQSGVSYIGGYQGVKFAILKFL